LVDLKADRNHPRKRLRPFASGAVSVGHGLLISISLVIAAVGLAASIGGLWIVLLYAAMSTAYSFFLKEKSLIDVFLLASLYTIRVVAGGVVSGYAVTEWLAGFCIFLFLSLAVAKRVAELLGTRARMGGRLARRGYTNDDVAVLEIMGVSSGFASALVLALYLQSQAAKRLYANPAALFVVVAAVLFWICRVWLQTARGAMHDDPVVWALKDRQAQVLGATVVTAIIFAIGHI
jgi:4-hydroxybenzoate polyprenyltransferase